MKKKADAFKRILGFAGRRTMGTVPEYRYHLLHTDRIHLLAASNDRVRRPVRSYMTVVLRTEYGENRNSHRRRKVHDPRIVGDEETAMLQDRRGLRERTLSDERDGLHRHTVAYLIGIACLVRTAQKHDLSSILVLQVVSQRGVSLRRPAFEGRKWTASRVKAHQHPAVIKATVQKFPACRRTLSGSHMYHRHPISHVRIDADMANKVQIAVDPMATLPDILQSIEQEIQVSKPGMGGPVFDTQCGSCTTDGHDLPNRIGRKATDDRVVMGAPYVSDQINHSHEFESWRNNVKQMDRWIAREEAFRGDADYQINDNVRIVTAERSYNWRGHDRVTDSGRDVEKDAPRRSHVGLHPVTCILPG